VYKNVYLEYCGEQTGAYPLLGMRKPPASGF